MLPKLLIADDDRGLHTVLKRMLKDTPYKLRSAYSGREALAAVKSELPDVMLLDVNMPDKNGLDVLRELRHNPATANLCVILVSGDISFANRIDGIPLMSNDCIPKPFDENELKERLSNALRHNAEISPHPQQAVMPLDPKIENLTQLVIRRGLQVNQAIETLHTRLNRLEQGANMPRDPRWRHASAALLGFALGALLTFAIENQTPSTSPTPIQASFVPAVPVLRPIIPTPPRAVTAPSPKTVPAPRPALVPVKASPAKPTLQSIRRQHFRVTLNTNMPVQGHVSFNPKFGAVVVNLPATRSGLKHRAIPGKGKLIRNMSVSPVKDGTRVMIFLAKPVNYKVRQEGKRIIVDFYYAGRVLR